MVSFHITNFAMTLSQKKGERNKDVQIEQEINMESDLKTHGNRIGRFQSSQDWTQILLVGRVICV